MTRFWVFVACGWAAAAAAEDLPPAVTDDLYAPVDLDEAELGQLLFYDAILSGNRTVSCATCHHPTHATADGVSLSIGDGGIGLGPDRRVDPANVPEERIPRNAPALFNLGASEFVVMFHDGRLEADVTQPSGIRTPMGGDMAEGFASVLSAQTMFPVLSRDEMAGSFRENDVALAVRQGRITGEDGAWDILSRRVAAVPEYAARFEAVYPHIEAPDDIAFTDISNAIAVFMAWEWRSDTSPFDAHLRGQPLTGDALAGLTLFYGDAGCVACHAGPFQTDHQFHAMGVPQIGPGKSATFEDHHRDEGRFRVTGDAGDLYAFRTPSLRNVARTGPWGHAGAHTDLTGFVRDHLDPVTALSRYDRSQVVWPAFDAVDFAVMDDPSQVAAIAAAVEVGPVTLSDAQIDQIVAFLHALTDEAAIEGRLGVPEAVPSGLPVP
ncbi:cytochrome-c peroxidase [Pseudooctadecabacter jejudonensis]|uniref:Cytochrome c551 peroxidase n=1 Tax=Pseudooctadecabacter jejudonensis TaxID=1391910 RepID=A0A1Y5T6A8_9RHOB|nr:cytochrome c peroxidase [Pseudooctadecabacter jejudonensis]SLN56517.1 Cytochrome c551 peroxidase precursor [Pseudooctadecabacter jejudonensis]